MRIITGSTGTTHVTSNDDGEFNQGIFGTDLIVFTNGEQLDAAVVDNNTIRVKDGDLIMQGRHALIAPNTTEDVIIETGAVGVNRNDLIVARYVMDTGTGYEDITLEVVKGTETAGEASDPEYVTGDIRTGSTFVEVPLYRVRITGISIAGIDKLFTPSMSMREMIATLNETLTQHSKEISELNNALSNAIIKLWENPNPSEGFSAQTITLSSDTYDLIEFICNNTSTKVPKGYDAKVDTTSNNASSADQYGRLFTYVSDTEYEVSTGYQNGTSKPSVLVPICIIGYKLATS